MDGQDGRDEELGVGGRASSRRIETLFGNLLEGGLKMPRL